MDLQNRAEAGGDGHDESVLNPEMPNETDLPKPWMSQDMVGEHSMRRRR